MKRVLVLSPHPDDETLGCGGTLRKHVLEGDSVRVIFLTSGEKGGHESKIEEEVRVQREIEARRAAAVLGIPALEFWREPDGALQVRPDLIDRLRAELEKDSPDLLYVPHEKEMHRDHAAAAKLVRASLQSLAPGVPRPVVRMFEIWTPLQNLTCIVDISDTVEKKIEAVRAYQSQVKVLRFDEAFLGLNRYRGEMHSWPGGPYAEVFEELL